MRKPEKEKLTVALTANLNTIHETFQFFDQTPASSLEKVSWDEVLKMGEQIYKQATTVGMLWTGEALKVGELEENMQAYFNMLQGFLLLSHGSTVGAGPTLSSSVHASVKQVVDCSFKLFKESISLLGHRREDRKLSIPQLVGAVWEACSSLKKTPATNITAIGRAMTQVAISMKDVLREMRELKPSPEHTYEGSGQTSTGGESEPQDDDNSSESELGNDLSPQEMEVAQLAIGVTSATLELIKELIRSITSLLKLEKPNDCSDFVDTLEKLLKQCQGIGIQIDELGACLYPPQEVPALEAALDKISGIVDDMQVDVEGLHGTSEAFTQACNGLRGSLRQMKYELDCLNVKDVEAKMQKVVLNV